MPTHGNEVMLTELEIKVLSVFVKEKILDDKQIAGLLADLILKLSK